MINLTKGSEVYNWARPTYLTKIQNFTGQKGYYNIIVQILSSIVTPFTELTSKKFVFQLLDYS